MLLTSTQVWKTCKAFANGLSVNIRLPKTKFHKIGSLGPLPKTGLPLLEEVFKPLAKSVLIPLGLTAAASF